MASLWVVIEKAYSRESRVTLKGLVSLSNVPGDGTRDTRCWTMRGVAMGARRTPLKTMHLSPSRSTQSKVGMAKPAPSVRHVGSIFSLLWLTERSAGSVESAAMDVNENVAVECVVGPSVVCVGC
jgi:hypothetical protein